MAYGFQNDRSASDLSTAAYAFNSDRSKHPLGGDSGTSLGKPVGIAYTNAAVATGDNVHLSSAMLTDVTLGDTFVSRHVTGFQVTDEVDEIEIPELATGLTVTMLCAADSSQLMVFDTVVDFEANTYTSVTEITGSVTITRPATQPDDCITFDVPDISEENATHVLVIYAPIFS